MPEPTAREITGLILCGGAGNRMGGVQKPLLAAKGRTLLEAIAGRLSGQVAGIVLSCKGDIDAYRDFGYPIVKDRPGRDGPLAGIEAGLAACETPYLFACPGDAPAIATTIVATLAREIESNNIAVAHDGQRRQNLFVLLRQSRLPSLTAFLDSGERKVERWLLREQAIDVIIKDPAQFINLNDEHDLARWNAS